MQWLSVALVPAVIALGIFVLSYVMSTGSGSFGFGAMHMSFNEGLGLVVGSWALGVVTTFPDLARFAKSPLAGALIGFFGIMLFNSLNFFLGAIGAALAREFDPALILLAAGVPTLALLMAIGNVWTTNDANLYSASLGISRAFPISRRSAVLIGALLSAIIAFFNPAQSSIFFNFLLVLGVTAPALGGVVLGGYFFVSEGHAVTSALPAWLGWVVGSAISYYVTGVVSVPAGFIAGLLVWVLSRNLIEAGTDRFAQRT
jgi:cytosine permease